MTPWEIHGYELANCNCDIGCPCQFMSRPTKGHCEAAVAFIIERGRHGEVDLAGLCLAQIFKWPGAVHEGRGTMQTIIDLRASPAQRLALERIATGEDTEEMATFWWVFAAMSPNRLETLFRPIALSLDYEARRGSARVEGVFDTDWQPVTNPVTGAEHRARIELPHGFEYRVAEVARATTRTRGRLALEGNVDSHAHLAALHIGHAGLLAA